MSEYQWAYSLVDSSRVSTFLISILLMVYGSFRSLNMEQEQKERNGQGAENNVQTLDTMQALCLPLGASISLLVMFFFFDSMQMLFAICTAIIATIALAFLLLPMCQYLIRPCSSGKKISFGTCGRFTAAELVSFSLSVAIVCVWVLTGHWLLMDGQRNGNGSVRGLHSICATAQPQGVHPASHGAPHIRRLLGVFLLIYLQCQCHGQSGHTASRQSGGPGCKETPPGQHGQGGP
uniref:Signal peptide peptidase-like 3 n=1 Tax=Rhipicephalus zambeziensis TaxID=60191 RepID=A0A224Z6L1_9ACAR